MEGFNRHVQQILDKVLDSPLPAEALNNAPVPARLAKAATAGQDLATEMETEGQNPSLHYCKLCQVWISGDLNCQAHLAGRKHIKRYKLYQQVQHKAGVPRSQVEGELEVEGSNNATVPPGDSVPLGETTRHCGRLIVRAAQASVWFVSPRTQTKPPAHRALSYLHSSFDFPSRLRIALMHRSGRSRSRPQGLL